MRVVKETDRYTILDDVLPREQFDLMLEYAGRADYARNPRWHASWGGELMIIEDQLGRARLPDKRHMKDGRVEKIEATGDVLTKDDLSQLLIDGTTETEFVFPKPTDSSS